MGRTVSFKNTIVVMTSNLTGPQTGKPGLGFIPDCADVRAQTVLREAFSPEFLGRIDCVASFRPLAAEDLAKIGCASAAGACWTGCKSRTLRWKRPRSCPSASARSAQTSRAGPEACAAGSRPGSKARRAELLLRDPSVRTLRAVWQQGSVQVKAAGGGF